MPKRFYLTAADFVLSPGAKEGSFTCSVCWEQDLNMDLTWHGAALWANLCLSYFSG